MTIGGFGLESKVLTKVVLITEDDEVCFCDSDFRKTCSVRLAGHLPCREMIIRFTPVDRLDDEEKLPEYITAISGNLKNVEHSFLKTLKHLERNKK